jgi:hypothetical protein
MSQKSDHSNRSTAAAKISTKLSMPDNENPKEELLMSDSRLPRSHADGRKDFLLDH